MDQTKVLFLVALISLFGILWVIRRIRYTIAFDKAKKVRTASYMTAGEVALDVLSRHHVWDAYVSSTRWEKGDSYDPVSRVVYLAGSHSMSRSLPAIVSAAHKSTLARMHRSGKYNMHARRICLGLQPYLTALCLGSGILGYLFGLPGLLVLSFICWFLLLWSALIWAPMRRKARKQTKEYLMQILPPEVWELAFSYLRTSTAVEGSPFGPLVSLGSRVKGYAILESK